MGLIKYKLGELIELSEERNSEGLFTVGDVRGISTEKVFIETKANMDGVSLDSYKVVRPKEFTYVPDTSRRGDKIALAYNNANQAVLISSIYTTFRCKRLDLIIPEYLFMFCNRPEFDRYSRFNSWGSARETFSWDDFCDIDITLPSIVQQHKYVDVYLALQNNLAAYQSKVEELKLVCDGYIENLKRMMPLHRIGDYIVESVTKNSNNRIKEVRSISVTKEFKLTNAKVNKNELSNYLVVKQNEIAFVQTTGNEKVLAFAYNDYDYPVVVSSVDKVFRSKDNNILDLQFLALFLSRKEFDRYARFNSWGSAREVFTMDDMNDVRIPIPDVSIQKEIVNIHKCCIERQRIATQLKEQLKNLCPILIKGSLQTEN